MRSFPAQQLAVMEAASCQEPLAKLIKESTEVATDQWPDASDALTESMHGLQERLQFGKGLLASMEDDVLKSFERVTRRIAALMVVQNCMSAFVQLGKDRRAIRTTQGK